MTKIITHLDIRIKKMDAKIRLQLDQTILSFY